MDSHSSSTSIHIANESQTCCIRPDKVETISHHICELMRLPNAELSVVIVDPGEMQAINLSHRGIDRPTDVLAFPQVDWPEPLLAGQTAKIPSAASGNLDSGQKELLLGDIVICPEIARSNAHSIGHELEQEVCFLLVHAFLHLCGHDHMEKHEEEIMIGQQKLIMSMLAELHPPPIWQGLVAEVPAHDV